ncbi:uncharacterized protein [Apostichopus japonicus]|uniref:uncharacterized protein n=1 Tax=Stichopus japonicus TaxID=307972 RepID=UPI003AB4FF75
MNPLTNIKNINKLNEIEADLGVSSKVSWHQQYKESAYIFVGGLPFKLSEGDILAIFSQYGEIVNINLVRDKKSGKSQGYCFIAYEDQRSTILAVDNLNGIQILGRTIRVDHVANYRAPKDHDDDDEETKTLRKEGCAPKIQPDTPPPVEVDDDDVIVSSKTKKEKKKKKDKKNKKKRKMTKEQTSSESDKDSDEDEKEIAKRQRGEQNKTSLNRAGDKSYNEHRSETQVSQTGRIHTDDKDDEPSYKPSSSRNRDRYLGEESTKLGREELRPSERGEKGRREDGDERKRDRGRSPDERRRDYRRYQDDERSRKYEDRDRGEDRRSRDRGKSPEDRRRDDRRYQTDGRSRQNDSRDREDRESRDRTKRHKDKYDGDRYSGRR